MLIGWFTPSSSLVCIQRQTRTAGVSWVTRVTREARWVKRTRGLMGERGKRAEDRELDQELQDLATDTGMGVRCWIGWRGTKREDARVG